MARNAPAFCEIWFVWRGRHIWTREASAATGGSIQDDLLNTKRIRFTPYGDHAEPSIMPDLNHDAVLDADGSNDSDAVEARECNRFYNMSIANWEDAECEVNPTFWSDSPVENSQLFSMQTLDRDLKEVTAEAEASRKEALVELLKRKEAESNVASALNRAKVSDSARKQEMRAREELEVLLAATRKQHEELKENKERAATGLESAMKRLALLDARTTTMSLRRCEVAAELEVIQSSIETLRQEKTEAQNQEERHVDKVEGCKYRHANCTSIAHGDHSCTLGEASSGDRLELASEAVRDPEQLHQKREKPIPSSFLCPILKEIMHDPQACADGFSYEGWVIREWMENGRETSPVTNLKLEHRNLTPNYTLRFAIKDWLSYSP